MRGREEMSAVPRFGAKVVAELLRRQPMSPGKVRLAWQIAAGARIARVADAEFIAPDTIRVHPKDGRWAAEIERSRSLLADRLNRFLGMAVRLEIA
jgi:hypothetical protein